MTTNLALGRKPQDLSRTRLRLTRDLLKSATQAQSSTQLPTAVPPVILYHNFVNSSIWGMDGNDAVGDCTIATRDHAVKTLNALANDLNDPVFNSTTDECISAYSRITGYTPSDPNTDQGAIMQDVLDYHRKTGIVLGGSLTTITLFAEIDHKDVNLVKWCIATFGGVDLGIDFPDSAMGQFDRDQPWAVVKGARSEGGHAIFACGYDDQYVYVVTWGKVQPMTWAFFNKYVEEAWVVLDDDLVASTSAQDSVVHTTLYALGQSFSAVTGKPNPIPAPVTPAPSPVDPAPVVNPPAPAPTPAPAPVVNTYPFPISEVTPWLDSPHSWAKATRAAKALRKWLRDLQMPDINL